MTSILESKYIEPTRPHSQKELACNRDKLYRYLRLGKVKAHHKACGHYYNVKVNSRKEKEINESKEHDVGNCSVCWRLHKTPRYLEDAAQDIITQYHERFQFEQDPKILTYYNVDIENVYYRWLYEY